MRRTLALRLGGAIEGGVLALACAAPWAFGSTSPKYEFALEAWIGMLAALWGVRILIEGGFARRWCPVAACLACMLAVAVFQMVPLPKGVLRTISPSTAKIYERLLPDRPEALPDGEAANPPVKAGSTLSFDRGVTRRDAGRLLAVLVLFAIVRGNVDPNGGLRRLSMVALANGSLLAFFGLIQAFSSAPHTIFWVYPTEGGPFGPFINRNHFAFYVNVCVGLAFGLLLARVRAIEGRGSFRGERGRRQAHPVGRMLLDPSAIAILFATGIMISGVLFSLSRGGFLALIGGLFFGLILLATRSGGRSLGGWVVLMAPVIAVALVCWIGYAQIADRLSTLRSGEAIREQRSAIWLRALPMVRDFPLWGTGCGTYEFADMLHRRDADDADMVVDHAHNDYLELLVEGGLALAIPGVLALALTFSLGLRGAGRLRGTSAGDLTIGALVGLAAIAIHSFTDFSLHIPSCTSLVVVLMALLSGLGGRDAIPIRGLIPAAFAAGLATFLGFLVAQEGWRAFRMDEIRGRASDVDQSGDPSRFDRKIAIFEEAIRVVPEDYQLREDLASTQLDAFDQRVYELTRGKPSSADLVRLKAAHLVPALRNLVRSRDLSPVRAMVHLEIAEHVRDFASADPREIYLGRTKLLAPGDPEVWYRCGIFEIDDGKIDLAWASWRQAVALSNRRLPEILDRAGKRLGPRDLLGRVLPENPSRLMEAATLLPSGATEGRRLFQEAALALLERRAGSFSADEEHLKATICRSLGRADEAIAAYRLALAEEPLRDDWRIELAEVSSETGHFDESRQELLVILGLQPDNPRARALLDAVTRKIAEGK